MFKLVFITVTLAAAAYAVDIPFLTCSRTPGPTRVSVSDCPRDPCYLAVGDQFTVEIGIRVAQNTTSLPTAAFLILENGTEVDFPLPSGDSCAAIAGGCPILAGEHTIVFPGDTTGLEPGNTTVRVEINDQNGNSVACGTVTTEFLPQY